MNQEVTMRPYLLLDVDGVLNIDPEYASHPPCSGGGCDSCNWTGEDPGGFQRVFEANGFVIRLPKGISQRLMRLANRFEVVWATTWMGDAVRLLAPELGIGEAWDFIDVDKELQLARAGLSAARTWKLPAIERWVTENVDKVAPRPVVWVDDDLGHDAFDWAKRHNRFAPTHLMATVWARGLDDEVEAGLMAWADLVEGDEDPECPTCGGWGPHCPNCA